MAYSASTTLPGRFGVSLDRSWVDRPQPVLVKINGFDYAGEVVFADVWQPWFGAQLPDRVMFRLVLLSEAQRVDRADVKDQFITVAVPDREVAGGENEFTQLSREIGRLNEIRERYVASNDTGLQALASSLIGKTSDAQHSIAIALAERWRTGSVVTSSQSDLTLTGDGIFIGDEPTTWVEAVAASMFAHHGETGFEGELSSPAALFSLVIANADLDWRAELDNRLRSASATGLDSIIEAIRSRADVSGGSVTGRDLVDLLLRQNGLPPGLASVLVAAFIQLTHGEAALLATAPSDSTRLNRHSLSTASYDPELVYSIDWLSERQVDDWNSALPYIRTLLPHAYAASNGIPDLLLEAHLMQVIETLESRSALTLRTLSSVSGPAVESLPSVRLLRRLIPVLRAKNWQSFYAGATEAFPEVSEFNEAVRESSRLRTLCEDVVDVQAAYEYVLAADYGRHDHRLAAEGEALRASLDVSAIVDSRRPAVSALQEFQNWKSRYTTAYRIHHSERRSAGLELARRIKRADLQHVAVQKLTKIPELHGILEPGFSSAWEELKEQAQPCTKRDDELALRERPYCQDCGVRMGSTGREDEVEARIAEIEQMLHASSVRLSEIAVSRVLSGQREDELRKLISMNAIADLTAISHVLDDGVMSFLHRFASAAPGEDQSTGTG